jgi:hypothetical protein
VKIKIIIQRRTSVPVTAAVAAAATDSSSFGTMMIERLQEKHPQRATMNWMVQKRLQSTRGLMTRFFTVLKARCGQRTERRLHVTETVALGEKRFVALLTFDSQEFLIGGGSAGVSLLSRLGSNACSLREASESGEFR